jgi:hypothetical protein
MAEQAPPKPLEVEVSLSGPAILSNRFFIIAGPTGVRITFAEQFGAETHPAFRTAVVLAHQDAIELAALLKHMTQPIEQQLARQAAAGKPANGKTA